MAVFESDTGKLAKDQGHSRLTPLWCGRGRSLLILDVVSRGQGQRWGGCVERPGTPWTSGGNTLLSCHFRLIPLTKREVKKGFKECLGWNPAILSSSFLFLVQSVNIAKSATPEWVTHVYVDTFLTCMFSLQSSLNSYQIVNGIYIECDFLTG